MVYSQPPLEQLTVEDDPARFDIRFVEMNMATMNRFVGSGIVLQNGTKRARRWPEINEELYNDYIMLNEATRLNLGLGIGQTV